MAMDPRLAEVFPKSFNQDKWDRVKRVVRPPLTAAVMAEDWEAAHEIWTGFRFIVEEAVRG
jgi:hypothetical protein